MTKGGHSTKILGQLDNEERSRSDPEMEKDSLQDKRSSSVDCARLVLQPGDICTITRAETRPAVRVVFDCTLHSRRSLHILTL